jgi:hypothetical protein
MKRRAMAQIYQVMSIYKYQLPLDTASEQVKSSAELPYQSLVLEFRAPGRFCAFGDAFRRAEKLERVAVKRITD